MLLSKIINVIDCLDAINFKDEKISSIDYDSREVKKGSLFFANKGKDYVENNFSGDDGHLYLEEAIKNGAIACVVNEGFISLDNYRDIYSRIKEEHVPIIVVKDTVKEIAKAAAFFYDYPSKKMNVVGITGTNGKTSTVCILEHILKNVGLKPGVVGSVSYRYADKVISNIEYTTPKALYFQKIMKDMVDSNVSHFACEVSSHGIDFGRVNNIDFDIAVFTNLSRDHLEYHENMENYFNAKKSLFTELLISSSKKNKYALINFDCEYGKKLYEILKFNSQINVIRYGFTSESDIYVSNYNLNGRTCNFSVNINEKNFDFNLNLVGKHNIYNALACIAITASIYNIDINKIKNALESFSVVSGRLESVIENYNIFVDYAHTDDALSNVLVSLKNSFSDKRIITVFGCGGNRDKGKRPKMARIVTDLSDYTYITSDNPRFEEPEKIIESMTAGVKNGLYEVLVDRRSAIAKAIKNMNFITDILLIAGKGHETYQEIKGVKYHFDDKEIVKEIIKSNL